MLTSIVLAAIAPTASPVAASPTPTATPPALVASSTAVQARLNTGLTPLAGNQPDHAPAMQVAIAQDGKIVYNQGFGTASTDTRFSVAPQPSEQHSRARNGQMTPASTHPAPKRNHIAT